MIYEQRLARARAAMRSQGIDLLLLTPSTDLFYLTGMRGLLFVCFGFTGRQNHVILSA